MEKNNSINNTNNRWKKIIILFIILAIFLIGYKIFENNTPKFSNPPCWYYTNESIREIKMYGINSSEITVLLNKDRSQFFVMEKATEEMVEECMK